MANYSFSRLERCYLQKQPVFGTIPNTSGTATVGNSNACRFIKLELQNQAALLTRADKTGSRSQEGGVLGRKSGTWNIEMSLAANGTPGTVPDCDPILVAAFGQTAALGAGTASISSSTAATPIVLSTGAHSIPTGTFEVITVAGHLLNVNANGTWLAYAGSTTSLTLVGSAGDGTTVGSATGTVSRVKLTYSFVDDIAQFTMWSFRTAGTLDQRVANTCVVSEMTFNLNQDISTWQSNGDCVWVLRSKDLGVADQYQLGGLTSFPSEPLSPVTNGSIAPGFTGRFTAGQSAGSTSASVYATSAVTFNTIRNATIRVQTQNMLVRDTFGSFYPTLTEGDVRNITLTFNVYDSDGTDVTLLKTWGDNKTPVDFVISNGTVAGNVWVHYLKNVYLASHVLGDGQLRFDATFSDSRATASSLALRDEYSLTIS